MDLFLVPLKWHTDLSIPYFRGWGSSPQGFRKESGLADWVRGTVHCNVLTAVDN